MHPALGVLCGLAAALLLSRWKVPMGAAFLAGATLMTLLSGFSVGETGVAFGEVLSTGGTWVFAAQVTLVFVLSTVMSLAGSLDVLVSAAGGLIRNRRARLASLPALVGLLPMPGGAVVSAPLVERTRCDVSLGSRDKNLINYWFRHVWEVCWPLYPPLLLAATFLPDHDTGKLCASQVPLCLLLLGAGWLFILRRVPGGADTLAEERPGRWALGRALLPLLLVVAAMPVCGAVLRLVVEDRVAGGLGLVLALFIGLLGALLTSRVGLLGRALLDRRVWSLLALAVGVKVFGGMVRETGAAGATADLIRAADLPSVLAVIVLPLFIGFVSGATIAVVSVSFPVIVALVGGPEVTVGGLLPYFVLGYAMGFIGYMLSPVHMCLVLSSRFFGQGVSSAYARLAAPLGLFLVGSGVVFVSLLGLLG